MHQDLKTPIDVSIRVALYARVSSDQQAQAGTIASQVDAIRQRIAKDSLAIEPAACFVDDGYSGATLIRPGLEGLRDLAAAGGVDRLYVLCPDRLARSYAYQMVLVEELRAAGVEVVFLNRELGKTPEDNLLLQVQGVVAEYERAKISERCRRGRLHAARRGSLIVVGAAPYGYRYLDRASCGGQARYNVHLEEAAVVRRIFAWVGLERMSLSQVRRRLREQGVASPRGRALWDRASLRDLLRNPAYKGLAAYGKRVTGPKQPQLRTARGRPEHPRGARSWHPRAPKEWIGIPVPAIVDADLFEAVAEQLDENAKRARQSDRGARYLLQGLVVCEGCGYAYCGRIVRPAPRTRAYGYYRCTGTEGHRWGGQRVCSNRQVHMERLDRAVWGDVRALLADPARVEQELQRRLTSGGADGQRQARDQLRSQIDKTRRAITRLIDAYTGEWLQKAEFETRVRAARQRVAQLERELQSQADQEAKDRELRLVIDGLEGFSRQVAQGLDQADWDTRREVIRTLVKRIEVGPESVRIVYRVDLNPFARRPDRGILHDCCRLEAVAPSLDRIARRSWTHACNTAGLAALLIRTLTNRRPGGE